MCKRILSRPDGEVPTIIREVMRRLEEMIEHWDNALATEIKAAVDETAKQKEAE
jgi:hypothetical protein